MQRQEQSRERCTEAEERELTRTWVERPTLRPLTSTPPNDMSLTPVGAKGPTQASFNPYASRPSVVAPLVHLPLLPSSCRPHSSCEAAGPCMEEPRAVRGDVWLISRSPGATAAAGLLTFSSGRRDPCQHSANISLAVHSLTTEDPFSPLAAADSLSLLAILA